MVKGTVSHFCPFQVHFCETTNYKTNSNKLILEMLQPELRLQIYREKMKLANYQKKLHLPIYQKTIEV